MTAAERRRAALVAGKLGMDARDVAAAVGAWFGAVVAAGRRMPLDRAWRIYSKERLGAMGGVFNVPHVGRIGPSYGKYLRWRADVSRSLSMVGARRAAAVHRAETVESLAAMALRGERIGSTRIGGRLPPGRYRRIWMLGAGGRRAARQLIRKGTGDGDA